MERKNENESHFVHDCKKFSVKDTTLWNEGNYYSFQLPDSEDDSGFCEDSRTTETPISYSEDGGDSVDRSYEIKKIFEDNADKGELNAAFVWEKSPNEENFDKEFLHYPSNTGMTLENAIQKYFLSRNLSRRRQRLHDLRNQQISQSAKTRFVEVSKRDEEKRQTDVGSELADLNSELNAQCGECVRKLHSADSGINLYFDIQAMSGKCESDQPGHASGFDSTRSQQGRSKRVDRLDNVQGPLGSCYACGPQTCVRESTITLRTHNHSLEPIPDPAPVNCEFCMTREQENISEMKSRETSCDFANPRTHIETESVTGTGNPWTLENEKDQETYFQFDNATYKGIHSILKKETGKDKHIQFGGATSMINCSILKNEKGQEKHIPFDGATNMGNCTILKAQRKHVRFEGVENDDDCITTKTKPRRKQVRFNGVISVNGCSVLEEVQFETKQNCGLTFWELFGGNLKGYSTVSSVAKRAKKNKIREKVKDSVVSWLNRKLCSTQSTKYISDIEAECRWINWLW